MGSVVLRSLVACLIFIISIYKENIYAQALENLNTSSPSPCSSTTRLRVGVPWKRYYREFVSAGENGTIPTGFCVRVFEMAIEPNKCVVDYITFGNGTTKPPSYDELIQLIVDKKIDAVVGDMTITANRSQKVVFTQPFLNFGVVAVVRLKDEGLLRFGWAAFTQPFTIQLWLLVAAFLICGGLVVYLLERRRNPRFRGQPTQQIGNILFFGCWSWFPSNQEDTRNGMGRIVVIVCLIVTGILYSCYTANLSAILTVPRLEPTVANFRSVVDRQDIKIGYWQDSFVLGFLKDMGIDQDRLKPLTSKDDYYNNLSRRAVDAIIDEYPYMQSLVANYCTQIGFAGEPLTTLSWGFAFDPTLHQLALNISSRILKFSEMRKIPTDSNESHCSEQSNLKSSRIQVREVWGLFATAGLVTVLVLFLYIVRSRCKTSRETDSRTRRAPSQPLRRAWRRRKSRRLPNNSENFGGLELGNPIAPDCSVGC